MSKQPILTQTYPEFQKWLDKRSAEHQKKVDEFSISQLHIPEEIVVHNYHLERAHYYQTIKTALYEFTKEQYEHTEDI